jgi:hypothetical protein
MKVSLVLLVLYTTVSIAAATSQTAKLTADDAGIMRAAIDAVVRPEMSRLEQLKAGTPILTFDRTIALCPVEKSIGEAMGCLSQENYSEIARLPTVFRGELQEPARAQIRTSFLGRNKSNVIIPPKAIEGVVLAAPAEISAKYDEKTGSGTPHATVSMPGLSSDGLAVVYVSYWCGNTCGYGWFVLLKRNPDGWQVVASKGLWVS